MLQTDALILRFPARAGYLHVSRLNASAVGAEAGFDVDELEDLRLAVTEAVTWLLADPESGGEVELVMSATDGTLRIDGTRSSSIALPDRALDDLMDAVLGATTDSHRLTSDGTVRVAQLSISRHGLDDT